MRGNESLPGAEEAVPCWSDCVAGGAVVEAGGCVVAHGRRLQATALLFQAAERERVFLFHSPLVFSFFFLCFVYQRSPLSSRFCFVFVSNFPPGFKPFLPSLYFGSSLFRFVLSSLRFVLFSHVFLFFSSAFFLFSPSFSFFFACWRCLYL